MLTNGEQTGLFEFHKGEAVKTQKTKLKNQKLLEN